APSPQSLNPSQQQSPLASPNPSVQQSLPPSYAPSSSSPQGPSNLKSTPPSSPKTTIPSSKLDPSLLATLIATPSNFDSPSLGPSDPSNNSSGTPSTTTIVGIAVGVIASVCIGIGTLITLLTLRAKKRGIFAEKAKNNEVEIPKIAPQTVPVNPSRY